MHKTRHILTSVLLLTACLAIGSRAAWGADGPATSPEKEKELLAVLRSDAPKGDKAIACKHLAVHGSSASVADLAPLLADEQLASWARIALEAIPGEKSDEALRKAMDSLQGKLLVGTINSIGVRCDANAVDPLTKKLQDQSSEIASAAAVALGNIGNAAATKALRGALAKASAHVRSAVAEGCVLCAERCASEGRQDEAAEIYDQVRQADVPKPRILEATRGAILTRKQQGIALLVETLRSPDKGLFQVALSTAREIQGTELDQALAAELAQATPERASLIVVAMADRKETVILPAVIKAAAQGPTQVRVAAIEALGRVGNASCLTTLLEIAQEKDAGLSQAAKAALADLPDENVDQELIRRLNNADGKIYPLLIELVGSRRVDDAMPALLKAVDHPDKAVRSAALASLGETVPAKNLSVLIARVVTPKNAEDAPAAQQALKAACVRMPDREACAGELATALERSPLPTKVALLEIIGAVGGTKALQTLGSAAKSSDAQLQDTSTRLLGEWMTIDAAPVLLDLAKTAPGEKYQVRALRGYIRIARQFVMPEQQRVEMTEKAFAAAKNVAEQKLVLEIAKRYPSVAMLNIVVKANQVPELKDEAAQATLVIAQKFNGKGLDARELLSKIGLDKVKLEIVKAEYGAGSTQKDVTEVLRKQVEDSPLIALASGYNATFGGDPAPGIAKQLKVQYRINGKAHEASFAENDLILLPMPK